MVMRMGAVRRSDRREENTFQGITLVVNGRAVHRGVEASDSDRVI